MCAMSEYLYIGPRADSVATLTTDALDATTERHHMALGVDGEMTAANPIDEINRRNGVAGVVIGLTSGIPDRVRLSMAAGALKRGLRVWLYWPNEQAVECVDDERMQSLQRHRQAVIAMERLGRPLHRAMESWQRIRPGLRWIYRGMFPVRRYDLLSQLERWSLDARPVPFRRLDSVPSEASRIDAGLYLRTDFWVRISSGGSYGHTCYVAKELAAVSNRFACLLPQRYDLLDTLGVVQAVMDPPPNAGNEDAIASASDHYYPMVKTACKLIRPAYIYERLCLGNWVAALLSRELQIPYLVEYNGSELSMQRSFNNTAPVYEDVYLKGEEVAFRQATAISVISEPVKADLVSR
jgi:hypothetical protein